MATLSPGHHAAAHCEEESALCSRRKNQILRGVNRSAGELSQTGSDVLQDRLPPAIGGIGLRAALFDAGGKQLKAAGGGGMCIHVAMAEIHRGSFELGAAQVKDNIFLKAFLAGRIVDAQTFKFFDDIHSNTVLSVVTDSGHECGHLYCIGCLLKSPITALHIVMP